MSSASRSHSKIEKSKAGVTARSTGRRRKDNGTSANPVDLRQDLKTVIDGALVERWQKFVRQVEKTRSEPAEKAVHDLRVALRRMIALLDMVKTILPKSGGARIRKDLKAHLRSLSVLRDTQVQILQVQQLLIVGYARQDFRSDGRP